MWRILLLGAAPTVVFGNLTLGPDGAVHASYHDLSAINSNGSAKWILEFPDADYSPYAEPYGVYQSHVEGLNNTVYVARAPTPYGLNPSHEKPPPMLVAVDSVDGSIKWKHEVGGGRELDRSGSPLVVAADGTIYLTSRGTIYRTSSHSFCEITTFEAFDPAGALKWNLTVNGTGSLSAVAVDGPARGTVFVDHSMALYALWPQNGTVKWSVDVAFNAFPHFTAFAEDGNVFLLQGNDTRRVLSSLSYEDGSVLWSHPFTPHGDSSEWWMTMNSRNELYVSGMHNCHPFHDCTCVIRVFDFDGNILRTFACLGIFDERWGRTFYPQYEDEENKFITTTWRGNVLAHSGTDGHLLWNVSVSNRSLEDRADFGRSGTVFVSSSGDSPDNHAYAIQGGKVAWSVQTGRANQQVMSEDGTTYIQGWTFAKEYGFKLEIVAVGVDGFEKWRYKPAQAAAMLV